MLEALPASKFLVTEGKPNAPSLSETMQETSTVFMLMGSAKDVTGACSPLLTVPALPVLCA